MNDAPDAPGYWGPSDQQFQPYRPAPQAPPQQAHPAPGYGEYPAPPQAQGYPGHPGGQAAYPGAPGGAPAAPGHRSDHPQQPPVYWGGDAEETQVMPPVPADPGPFPGAPDQAPPAVPGRSADPAAGQSREAGRLSGPLFRDEQPEAAVPGVTETVVLRAISDDVTPAPGRGAPPYPGAPVPPVPPPSHPAAGQPRFVPSSHPGQETPVAAQSTPQPQPRKQRGGRNLQAAIGVGVGLGVVIIASLFVVKALFLFVVMAAVSVGVWELTSRLAERKQIKAPLVPLVAGGIAMLATGYWAGVQWAAASLVLTGLAVMVWRMVEPPENYLRDITAGVFTAFYVPFLATFVALMLAADDGPQRIVLFLIVTICSDTGAYAVGYKFGRTKLAPTISPGKTREGLAGGIGLSMLAGAVLMQLIIDGGSWWQGLILGGCAAVTATLGDLGESMIKRDLGIKDMGTLLPGHGGIMDRLDSLLPTAPVVWLLLAAFVGS
ncbi:CDP-diglyceride synthetase [Kitasatospora sp. MAA19]|uniref:phosphatidate cytidylyltransferase n=1 Tax=Kitasatospora sp. MAA19 TaxID=3035090 RepID=UPI0024758B25|nr:phosphatidate cytidylyltransferase [Kitasatospora sp. MAA19]MDH6710309.1 CDP-diglyceride synthetase [Kitasatospora sp. MAA19]